MNLKGRIRKIEAQQPPEPATEYIAIWGHEAKPGQEFIAEWQDDKERGSQEYDKN